MCYGTRINKNLIIFVIAIIIQLSWIIWNIYYTINHAITQSDYVSLLSLLLIPLTFLLTSFYINMIITCIINIFMPIKSIKKTSKHYICEQSPNVHTNFIVFSDILVPKVYPHITIQIPVYTESFDKVIKPTLLNVYEACENYRKHFNGSYTIFINDDGLMTQDVLILEKIERTKFYREYGITYVGRPQNNRVGKFKKASNMNFCLREVINAESNSNMYVVCDQFIDSNDSDDVMNYHISSRAGFLAKLAKTKGYMAGSLGNKHILGKYILLLDSDSRMSVRSLGLMVQELEKYENLDYGQIYTNAMQIQYDYWENLISYFTNNIYSIAFVLSSSGGDPAPLVGHNAIIPFSVMSNASWICSNTGEQMFWSEHHVSEDFDMSLRIQGLNLEGKYINLENVIFSEGVSLTVDEEYVRFRKYAYGVSEILMNPIKVWCKKSICSDTFKKYLKSSNIPIYTKYNLLAYMMSYYTLAFSPMITIANYFGFAYSEWWAIHFMPSVNVIIGCVIVYSVILPISNVSLKMRLSDVSFLECVKNEVKYGIMIGLFFGGTGYHFSVAFISHIFGSKMSWSTTKKEIGSSTTRCDEFRRIFSTYRTMYIIMSILIVMIFIFAVCVPDPWKIKSYISIVPILLVIVCHIFSPILLNTCIMCNKSGYLEEIA
jgi:hypothetical protein